MAAPAVKTSPRQKVYVDRGRSYNMEKPAQQKEAEEQKTGRRDGKVKKK